MPSRSVENDELPEDAVKRELLEETGFLVGKVELLSVIQPDTGRLGNKMWCYFSDDVVKDPSAVIEKGLVPVNINEINQYILEGKINNALHLAALYFCHLKGKI